MSSRPLSRVGHSGHTRGSADRRMMQSTMRLAVLLAGDALLPSRIQMAFTLAYHILLVPFGVALPFYTLSMEAIGIFRGDPVALRIARRWSVVMAAQFAVGAVTGTILSFEFGILWPKMLGRFGAAFGLGFAIEGIAFFLEAIFIGIYLYGWSRLPPRIHFVLGLVLIPAGLLGAFGVLSANSWMNTPGGVTMDASGQLINVDALAALFTRALPYEFWHFVIAIYLTAVFFVASIYAVAWLRGRRDHYQRLALAIPFTVAGLLGAGGGGGRRSLSARSSHRPADQICRDGDQLENAIARSRDHRRAAHRLRQGRARHRDSLPRLDSFRVLARRYRPGA